MLADTAREATAADEYSLFEILLSALSNFLFHRLSTGPVRWPENYALNQNIL